MPGDLRRHSLHSLPSDQKTLARAFGLVLRKRRIAADLAQLDIAAATDLERSYISMLERGIYQPSLATIVKIAEFFAVSPSALIAEVEAQLQRENSRAS